ncbi:MAG: esterase family protein [Fibrobacteres bacterium]|nr:esterase family protein [Fibrobacterota bacterium]
MSFKNILPFLIISLAVLTSAATVDTVMIFSASMRKPIPNIVIRPDSYQKTDKKFSSVYLLHGAGGKYTSWLTKVPELVRYADAYDIIIICPDGSVTSWYFDSPVDSTMKYETYVASELVRYIDSSYKTYNDKKHRAIAGLSMGGHGALYLSMRHQDMFGTAGSMSGGVDIRPFTSKWDLELRLGTYSQHPDNWNKNTVANMLHLLKGSSLRLIIDCGVDDFFYDINKKLHADMVDNKIPHDYIERPGAHTWDYWRNSVKYQLLFFNEYFKN